MVWVEHCPPVPLQDRLLPAILVVEESFLWGIFPRHNRLVVSGGVSIHRGCGVCSRSGLLRVEGVEGPEDPPMRFHSTLGGIWPVPTV